MDSLVGEPALTRAWARLTRPTRVTTAIVRRFKRCSHPWVLRMRRAPRRSRGAERGAASQATAACPGIGVSDDATGAPPDRRPWLVRGERSHPTTEHRARPGTRSARVLSGPADEH